MDHGLIKASQRLSELNLTVHEDGYAIDVYWLRVMFKEHAWLIRRHAQRPATSQELGFAVIEYFATKEGGLLLTAGIEGNDYTMQDGKVALTDLGKQHAKDHGAPIPISRNFDMSILGPANPGFLESVALGKRTDVAVAPMGYANGALDARAYYDIMAKWMTECIMGRTAVDQAMKNAGDELRLKKLID